MKGIVTAIEFGSSKIACLSGARRPFGKFELLQMASCSYAGYRKKSWLQPDALGYAVSEALRKAEDGLDKKTDAVFIGIPGAFSSVIHHVTDLEIKSKSGTVAQSDLQALHDMAGHAEKPDHLYALKSYIAYYMADGAITARAPLGYRAGKISCGYTQILLEERILQDITEVCRAIGLRIEGFACVPDAIAKLVVQEENTGYAVIVDIGYYVTDVMVTRGTKLVCHKTLEIGGYHLANDISLCLNVPMDEAEHLKRKMTVDSSQRVVPAVDECPVQPWSPGSSGGSAQDIMMARLDEICILIAQALRQCGFSLERSTPLHLTGGGISMLEGVERYVHQRLDEPVKVINAGIQKVDAGCFTAALSTLFYAFVDGK